MSQQINLLTPRRESVSSALWSLAAVGVAAVCLTAYWASAAADTAKLRAAADAGERNVARSRSALQSVQQRLAAGSDAAALKAEIAILKPRVDAIAQLLDEVRGGSLGSAEGFSRYLLTLGSVPEDGLWITKLTVGKAGKSVSVSGRALRTDSVMRYARRLNEAFVPYGVQFSALEMSPEDFKRSGDPLPVLTTVTFRLY